MCCESVRRQRPLCDAHFMKTRTFAKTGSGQTYVAYIVCVRRKFENRHVSAGDFKLITGGGTGPSTAMLGIGGRPVPPANDPHDLNTTCGKKTFSRLFSMLKLIILPRQARDKHRENLQKGERFLRCGTGHCTGNETDPADVLICSGCKCPSYQTGGEGCTPCLFDVTADPGETTNLASKNPGKKPDFGAILSPK